jgi:ATP-binding cassette subfamily B protein
LTSILYFIEFFYINLTIRPGEIIAFVGENGAGKTTLVKLLCRLYDPTEGSITWDGIDIKEFNKIEYRRQVSVVFQDYAQYDLTAQENIWFGNIHVSNDAKNIMAAAEKSGAHAVIKLLPDEYRTLLGKRFADGEQLSIGQWQKIALARAFFRDSQVIVLDEPSSALDAKAEAEVFDNFRQLIRNRTGIMISHRLSSVKMADCLYVLEKGKIVEQGRHEQLMQQEGSYARMFEMQAKHYK